MPTIVRRSVTPQNRTTHCSPSLQWRRIAFAEGHIVASGRRVSVTHHSQWLGRKCERADSDTVELTFLGDAFEGFAGTLNPVLIVIAFGRQQLDHRIATAGSGATEARRGVINCIADSVLVRHHRNFRASRQLWRQRCADHLGRVVCRLRCERKRVDCRAHCSRWAARRFRRLLDRNTIVFDAFLV